MLLIFLLLLSFQDVKISIFPVNFQDEENPKTFITGIQQLSTSGSLIFVVPTKSPTVLVLNDKGEWLYNIGRAGEGPGELGRFGPESVLPVSDDSIWIQHNNRHSFLFFEKGEYSHQFKVSSVQFSASNMERFNGDENVLVIPSHPGKGKIAGVYNYGGELTKSTGEILKISADYYNVNPALNNTIWSKDDFHWYCAFSYRPIVRKFDRQFKLVDEFQISGPEIDEKEKVFLERKKNPKFTFPQPHFTDMQVFGAHLYLLTEGTMIQVDTKSGEIVERAQFFNELKTWKHTGRRLTLKTFTIIDDGTVFLAHRVFLGEQDMWRAKVPFIHPEVN